MGKDIWTKEQEDYLRYLYSKDCMIIDFVSDFNRRFGTNRSKNSLIRKANRLNISNGFIGGSRYNHIIFKLNEKEKVGQTKVSRDGATMKIVEYNGANDITVEFMDDLNYKVHAIYHNFQQGTIFNPGWRMMYNRGYIGVGPYEQTIDNKPTKAYDAWRRMFDRCYNAKYHEKYPTYIDCEVCEEWFNFQNFAKWFYNNYYEVDGQSIEVDKDWYVIGNKTYCPNSCCLVPNLINTCMLTHDKIKNHDMPIGVMWHKNGSYVSRCSDHGKRKIIGYYNNIKDAENAYWNYKINYISRLADEYKKYIPDRLYDAMKDFKNTYKQRYNLEKECEVI